MRKREFHHKKSVNKYHRNGRVWYVDLKIYFDKEFTWCIEGQEIISKTLGKIVRDIANNYYISEDGEVLRLHHIDDYMFEIIEIVPTKNNAGYLQVSNPHTGKGAIGVHRLVAQAFIPNPQQKKEVNHKDCNKENNSVGNLEWVTRQENMEYYYKNRRK